ncbi:hypothetical protein J5N97_020729 [Dioscorea zingiberensis]|uniref:Sec39 domain-containing protein n=1 Tax=Dioscorea zingiberensis TaxID=325984 RepID=A0A9D5CH29_9LILI|nr:hypothetical protein J5N97_020729 [Dioscorea zingiberensis]
MLCGSGACHPFATLGALYQYLVEFKTGEQRKEATDQSLKAYQAIVSCNYLLPKSMIGWLGEEEKQYFSRYHIPEIARHFLDCFTQEYVKFRVSPLTESAISLAESGKIGALNLLFKRHPYSLSPSILDILSAIPETLPVQTYGQLLLGRLPPNTFALRDDDWLECQNTVEYMNKLAVSSEVFPTEIILKHSRGFVCPLVDELTEWYKKRAKDIDNLSGQLDNCLSLVEFACCKGIAELQKFREKISYLHQLIYSDEIDETFNMSLGTWDQLPDYEKFKMMLKGVREDNVVGSLRESAIPFMHSQLNFHFLDSEFEVKEPLLENYEPTGSFLVTWLKEVAAENKLEICLPVIENACGDSPIDGLFKDEAELIKTALQCIYLCTLTDQWNIMASILLKLHQKILRDKSCNDEKELNPNHVDMLEKRMKIAEGHVEVGRLLAYYQQHGRSYQDWANMWRDMQCFQGKAFPFLDAEYMLIEFIRRLLKAGEFSLARNYLKGTGSVVLDFEKAENLVIQASREYFFSASSFACDEVLGTQALIREGNFCSTSFGKVMFHSVWWVASD